VLWDVLIALNADLPCKGIYEIEAEAGYSHPTTWRALHALCNMGYASHPRYYTWIITERGKIALAIRAGREQKRAWICDAPSPAVSA